MSRTPGSLVELFLPGAPLTRKEPIRAKNGRMYPNPKTTMGMQAWWAAWAQAGRLQVVSPVVLELYVRVARPASHYTTSGLSAAGRSFLYPPRFDLSNVLKLVEDALKGHAFADDSHVVAVHASKQWVAPGDRRPAGTYLSLRTASLSL